MSYELNCVLQTMYEEASQVATDAVGSIRTVASFCAEDKIMQLYKKKCEGPMKTGIRQGLVSGAGFGLGLFFLFSAYATSFFAGAELVNDRKITFSDVFRVFVHNPFLDQLIFMYVCSCLVDYKFSALVLQVFFALTMAAIGITQSSSFTADSDKARIATASIFSILDRESKIDPSDDSGMTLQTVNGDIEFRHISFRYPSRPDVQILRDLSLAIHSGKVM